ncbi:hypothetical protein I7I50_02410 [Histoplasma capsulatum G186AR]|uniref:Uncharacterized protein n=1 Tax=Ajellomyces capsulatus TaxID=5037 RepID=A0A8H7Z6I4_AJECA|nr:hypothetical protein I7I52_00926 [Histoplasma capsulatum]QSS71546.1 hypothetical protein I7I50_02410 [Histoplasma capsulatum G186AR]
MEIICGGTPLMARRNQCKRLRPKPGELATKTGGEGPGVAPATKGDVSIIMLNRFCGGIAAEEQRRSRYGIKFKASTT